MAAGSATARAQPAVPHGFRGQHAEQVEIRRFLIFEEADLVPGVFGATEHLIAAVGLEKAHGSGHFFVDRVGGPRDVRHIHEISEDR